MISKCKKLIGYSLLVILKGDFKPNVVDGWLAPLLRFSKVVDSNLCPMLDILTEVLCPMLDIHTEVFHGSLHFYEQNAKNITLK
jgi:hypothetical protein